MSSSETSGMQLKCCFESPQGFFIISLLNLGPGNWQKLSLTVTMPTDKLSAKGLG